MFSKFFNKLEKQFCLEKLGEHNLPTEGDYWWTRNPKRYLQEVIAMQLNTQATLILCNEKLCWQEWITNNFDKRFFIYP